MLNSTLELCCISGLTGVTKNRTGDIVANPQPKYHTRLSNELLQKLMQMDLGGIEFRIIMCWFRHGYGYHRKAIAFGSKFIMDKVGVAHRQQVHRAMQGLISRAVFSAKVKGKVMFNKNYDEWLDRKGDKMFGLTKREMDSKKDKKDNRANDDQIIIDVSGKDKLINVFADRYRKKNNVEYIISWARNKKTQKALLKRFGNNVDYCIQIIDELFNMKIGVDDFSCLDTGWILNKLIKIIQCKSNKEKEIKLLDAARKQNAVLEAKQKERVENDPDVQKRVNDFKERHRLWKERKKYGKK